MGYLKYLLLRFFFTYMQRLYNKGIIPYLKKKKKRSHNDLFVIMLKIIYVHKINK